MESVALIDFDFAYDMLVESQRLYPPYYAAELPDGERHPEATGRSPVKLIHDVYACGGLVANLSSMVPGVHDALQSARRILLQAENNQALNDAVQLLMPYQAAPVNWALRSSAGAAVPEFPTAGSNATALLVPVGTGTP